MSRLPPPFNVTPGTWRQPLHSRGKQRYVTSEKELRRAISDAIAAPAVNWSNPGKLSVYEVGTSSEIIVTESITLTDTVDIPYTAGGLTINCVGGGSFVPAELPKFASGGTVPAFKVGYGSLTNKVAAVTFNNVKIRTLYIGSSTEYDFSKALDIKWADNLRVNGGRFDQGVTIEASDDCVFSDATIPDVTVTNCARCRLVGLSSSGDYTFQSAASACLASGCVLIDLTIAASCSNCIVAACVITGTITNSSGTSNANQGTGNENNV